MKTKKRQTVRVSYTLSEGLGPISMSFFGSADRAIVCATFPSSVTNRSRWTHKGIRCANAAALRNAVKELRTILLTPSSTVRGLNQSPRKNPNTRLVDLSFSTQLTFASWPVTLHTVAHFIRTLPTSMGDWRPYPPLPIQRSRESDLKFNSPSRLTSVS